MDSKIEFSLISSALSKLQKSLPMYYVCEVSSLTRNLVSDSYIYLLNIKMRLTMLCSNGFELYSRWLPLVSVWLRSKKRGTRVKDRVKNGAHIGVGTPISSPGRFSLALGAGRESALGTRLWGRPPRACSHFPIYWLEKKIFFSNSLCTYQLLHVFCQQKGFLAGSARPVKNKKTN